MCFVFIREKTATCATYSINWLVFITEMKSVYSAVRTGSLNKAVCASSLKGYSPPPCLSIYVYTLATLWRVLNELCSPPVGRSWPALVHTAYGYGKIVLKFILYNPHGMCRLFHWVWMGLAETCCGLRLKCDGTRAETRFRLSAKRSSPFKSVGRGGSVQSTTGSRGVRIGGSTAGYTMFRGSVKGTGHPLHSSVSPLLPLPCFTVCRHISTGLYWYAGTTECRLQRKQKEVNQPRVRKIKTHKENT